MSQTDPIAELLTRIRNAMHARYNELDAAAFARARSDLPRAAGRGIPCGDRSRGRSATRRNAAAGTALLADARARHSRASSASASRACAATRARRICRRCSGAMGRASGVHAARRDDRPRGAAQKVGGEILLQGLVGDYVAHRKTADSARKERQGHARRRRAQGRRAQGQARDASCIRASTDRDHGRSKSW